MVFVNELAHSLIIKPQQADGVLKQLPLPMFVYCALLSNIVLYHLLVAVCADCTDEVSFTPELASPQVCFDLRAGLQYLACRALS